jgi:hypothetical protein
MNPKTFFDRLVRLSAAVGLIAASTLPSVVLAASATPDQVLKALSEAQNAGLCSSRTQKSGSDCSKTVTTCDASKWAAYIGKRYLFQGGAIVAQEGQAGPYDALEYLRADWDANKSAPPGPVQTGTCFCECQSGDAEPACQGKSAGFPYKAGEQLTRDACAAQCGNHPMANKCAGTLPSLTPAGSAAVTNDRAFCFTPADCTAQDGIFEAYAPCGNKGRCFAQEPIIQLGTPIGSVKQVQGISQYIVTAYRYLISISAVVATIAFSWGAFMYLIGSALPSINSGKRIMQDSVIGLILVLGATGILRTINPATTKLNPLKVYMVNAIQFVNTAMCNDLGASNKLAEAGTRPNLKDFDKIAPEAFTVAPAQATCGKSYYVDGSTGSACDGSLCPGRGEACVSCSDGLAKDCNGKQSDDRVCDRVVFGGTIDFRDGKYPTGLDLLAVCNYAQNNDPKIVQGNITVVKGSVKPTIVGRAASSNTTTDKNQVGRGSYRFDLTELDTAEAAQDCPNGGGLRGFLLGIVYKESYSSVGGGIDDVAVLSKQNCGGGRFDGYENGSVSDTSDEAAAIACGVKQGKFQNANGVYWTKAELDAAAQGVAPILCNFQLSNQNAPTDPAGKFCPKPPPAAGSSNTNNNTDTGTPDLQQGINSLN